jgi:hypothetical protein
MMLNFGFFCGRNFMINYDHKVHRTVPLGKYKGASHPTLLVSFQM